MMLVPTPFLDFFIKSNILQSRGMTVSVCFGRNVDLIKVSCGTKLRLGRGVKGMDHRGTSSKKNAQ